MSAWPSCTPITALGLSVRTYNVLHNHMGLRTVGDILQYTDAQLLRQENFGRKSLGELKDRLAKRRDDAGTFVEQMASMQAEIALWRGRYEGALAAITLMQAVKDNDTAAPEMED